MLYLEEKVILESIHVLYKY